MEDLLRPKTLVLPRITTAVRFTLCAEPGTLVYDTDINKICISNSAVATAASWGSFAPA